MGLESFPSGTLHTIRFSPGLSHGADLIELFTGGEGSFLYQWSDGRLEARTRHADTPRSKALTTLYNLMVGLFEAGCDVQVEGPWSGFLPEPLVHTQPRPALAIRSIFEHHLPAAERQADLAPDDRMAIRQRARQWQPASCRRLMNASPHRAGSWGEVRMGWRAGTAEPEAVHILPGEVALVRDVGVYRYFVEDRSTLLRLDFGQGKPLLYDAPKWLEFAEDCGARGDYQLALDCCEQAQRAGGGAEVDEERQRWLQWRDYRPEKAALGAPPELASLQDLIDIVGFENRLRQVAEDIAWERRRAQDEHRQPRSLTLDYPTVTGHDLLAAGMTPAVMNWLGLGSGPIPPPARYKEIFTLRCGEWVVWGTVASGYLMLREDPGVLYRTE